MSFSNLGLSADLLRAVVEQGYTEATPVQLQAIPLILAGKDVLAGAQTGTGKTAGFTLPMLHRLHETSGTAARRPVRALVLTPTRELAAQVEASVQTYGKYLPLRSAVIFGGVKINPQIEKLRRGVDVLVATPGRLLDHMGQGTVDLSRVEILVLDEADRMLDMGFIHDIRRVLAELPDNSQRQNLLFSATFSTEIKQLADRLLNQPVLIEIARQDETTDLIRQVVHPVDKNRKREMLSHMIGANNWRQVLVFTRTKHGANRLAQQLEADGLSASAIHGNKSQGARTRALAEFKRGDVRVLVATDIAARGLDIDQLPHVVNYELPNMPEDYVHRIGRTGRAGREGEAVSLVCVDELKLLRDIERLLGNAIPSVVREGYEVDPSIRAEPIKNGRNGNSQRRDQGNAGRRDQAQSRRRGSPASNNTSHSRGRSAPRSASSEQRQAQDRTGGKPRPQHNGNAAPSGNTAAGARRSSSRSAAGPGQRGATAASPRPERRHTRSGERRAKMALFGSAGRN